jgi:hypothetical protein
MAIARQPPTPTTPLPSLDPSPSVSGGPVVPAPPEGITFADFAVDTEVVRSPTTSTAQSKLWFADGRWWGALFGPTNRLGIFVLDPATQVWADTGTLIDERPIADADMLWDGSHLYAISGGSRPSENHAIHLRRYTFVAADDRFALDPDYPVTLRPTGASPAVLAMDSTGVLWATFVADGDVLVTHTLEDETIWSEPVALPAEEARVETNDVSSIIAFGPGRIGVAWTNQRSGIHFSSHRDGDPDGSWSAAEAILQGELPDDQLSLAAYPVGGGSTNVVAAVSTTQDQIETGRTLDPLTLLAMRREDASWGTTVVGLVRDRHARPIVLVDPATGTVSVAATSPGSGGAIYYKRASLDQPAFDTGVGVPLIANAGDRGIDSVTSAKGPLATEAGLLVLASDRVTGRYLHGVVDLGAGPPTADPADPSRPRTPSPPPRGTVAALLRDTFEPWPVGPTAPSAWYTRPEDPPGTLSVAPEGATDHALRVTGAALGVRACRDMPALPEARLTVQARVRLSGIASEDATILSVRGSGGEAASVRVTNDGVLAWFDGETKIRSTTGIAAATFYRVTARIDQTARTYDIRVTTDDETPIATVTGLKWRQPAVRTVSSVCVETAPAPPAQGVDVAEVSVSEDVRP